MTEEEARAAALAMIPASDPLTLSELEQYLAGAVDLLRGAVDQADFKAYIFPMMLFKRISDVYLEEYGQALADSGGGHEFASFAESHRFTIPDGCLWDDLRERTENVGQALVHTFREIEKANPETLHGIFGNAGWTNKQELPDRALVELIEHFSSQALTSAAVSPDVFGDAYEYLLKRFADQSNKKTGEYYTPRSVVRLLVDILDPKEQETVYDPACGTGGMLIEVIEHVKRHGGEPKLLRGRLFGQEKVLATSGIARTNLLLHGVEDFKIIKGDTLREPAFYSGDRLARFSCVIANPPFSLKDWGREQWSSDRWGRNQQGGTPPKSYADWAWVQHMIASMKPDSGRVAVVLPQGALFRGGAEAKIRKAVLASGAVDAVIGLAPNLFYGTGLAACVLILRHTQPEHQRDGVQFINAETLYRSGRNQNTMELEHAAQILELYRERSSVLGMSAVADMDAISANDGNLNIPLYVEPADDGGTLTLPEALDQLANAQAEARRTALKADTAVTSLLDTLRAEAAPR